MRPRWLAWAAFIFCAVSRKNLLGFLYSLFVRLILPSKYAAAKIWVCSWFSEDVLGIHKPFVVTIAFASRNNLLQR